ncbi:MAG TPA: DUF2934 domain-containing protein [Rhizomicrobium sp.]|jgi:hypothetical protein|nr:DUF2934 domain-containing protein [Rhizomicrobium sp.]
MVNEEDIRIRSYLLWEAAGRPDGHELEFWLQAEADLEAELRYSPKPWIRLAVAVVPRVPVSSSPHRIVATRVPPRERKIAASAAAMR